MFSPTLYAWTYHVLRQKVRNELVCKCNCLISKVCPSWKGLRCIIRSVSNNIISCCLGSTCSVGKHQAAVLSAGSLAPFVNTRLIFKVKKSWTIAKKLWGWGRYMRLGRRLHKKKSLSERFFQARSVLWAICNCTELERVKWLIGDVGCLQAAQRPQRLLNNEYNSSAVSGMTHCLMAVLTTCCRGQGRTGQSLKPGLQEKNS